MGGTWIETIIAGIIAGGIAGFFSWLLALWNIYRESRIVLDKFEINAPDDFKIKLVNKGSRKAAECIVILETAPFSESKQFLSKYSKPMRTRMDYILESEEMSKVSILYSCWPIIRDEILPDMTDMEPGTTYEFMSYLPPFLEPKKERLKAGDWTKRISFPKEQGRYIAAISVYNGVETTFIFAYEYLNSGQTPKLDYIGKIQSPRKIDIAFIRLKLWLRGGP